jgi:hypothetical protein
MNPPLEASPPNLRSGAFVSQLRRRLAIACAFTVVLAPAVPSPAAPITWAEAGDAGQTLATAQLTVGFPTDTLAAITGNISAASDHDLFEIRITNGATFSATTVDQFGTPSTALDDTQLFLFNSAGIGVYANDDDLTASGALAFRSTLTPGGSPTPITPGLYYLLIDAAFSFPVSTPATVAGLIFPNSTLTSVPSVDSTAVVGPIGPGGALPLTGYTGTASSFGVYEILLTGASPAVVVPEPRSFLLLATGILGMLTCFKLRRGQRVRSRCVGVSA